MCLCLLNEIYVRNENDTRNYVSRQDLNCVLMQHGKIVAYVSLQFKKHELNSTRLRSDEVFDMLMTFGVGF